MMTWTCPHCGKPILSRRAQADLDFMRREAPNRGGYMWEGARVAYEAGTYKDPGLDELLSVGAIKPHADPKKGWVVNNAPKAEEDET